MNSDFSQECKKALRLYKDMYLKAFILMYLHPRLTHLVKSEP
ncbi:hypothetical protein SBF1_3740017 [Candidatus Desulfosporosinus infrequens]|uniref:Uncharacterized protein n=1 Tax=Candidatus Desulfosporosinus infrequens TaxID=2043169 RepID=A0A2U3L505_9FIRM|nr:hypothetical protein SBF1_3740017 [Candidatus Desulfosporosinus infrequens]